MFDGILSSITDSLNILKPPETGGPSFKQPEYPGQGLVTLGRESIKKPPQKMAPLPTVPELNAQMELQKKAPFVARTPDQAVLNKPTASAESKMGFNPDMLMMALSTLKPKKQENLMSMSSGRVGGGFRAPDASLYETPGFREKFARAGADKSVPISELLSRR